MTENNPDPTVVLDLIEAFRRSKTMFAAVSLGVFDALADGGKPAEKLAGELQANLDALTRLLDACVGLKLLEHTADGFANTPAANAYLCKKSPRRVTSYINYSNEILWKLWENLEDGIREGTHRWKQSLGLDGPIFTSFFRTDAAMREFLMGMNGFGLMSSPPVAAAFDLSRFRRLVDLGGATGHLPIAACERYPNLRAVVFDLPQATVVAKEILAASPLKDRITVEGGDFFTDPLPEGDLYALGRIVHDWTEEKCLRLLNRIFERLPKGGALLICEKLLAEDRNGPVAAQMQSLNMLLCTEGKERTLSEYRALLQKAGFTDVQGSTTNAPVDAVLAWKR